MIEFTVSGAPPDCRQFWLVSRDGDVETCLKHPGHDVDVRVGSELRVFIEAWRGFRDLEAEIAAGRIRVIGPLKLRKQFPGWFRLHVLAGVARKRW